MRATIIHRVTAVNNLPEHVPDQIKQGDAVQAALANNHYFPLPDPIITAFITALGNYSTAATAAQTRAKGTIAARNAAKVVYVGAYHALRARVQTVADADPENAEAIITSAGFAVRKTSIRQKQTFAAKYGAVVGHGPRHRAGGRTRACVRVAVQPRRWQDLGSGSEHDAGEDHHRGSSRRRRRSSSGFG